MALLDMAGHVIRRMHQISGHVFLHRMEAAGYDITPVQFAAMQALQFNPGIEQAQVAALIAYDRATIGGVIDRLEQKGYASRVVSSKDRRAREVRLTESGLSIVEELLPIVERMQNDILSGLSEAEQRQFLALAKKVVSHGLPEENSGE